jgi:predicted small secreted protein
MNVLNKLGMSALLLAVLTGSSFAVPQNNGAGQDIKDAGSATKDAAKDTGRATKKTAKKTGHAVKKTTKKVVHGTAKKTKEGADKVEDKTKPN